jgi:hypothetical protein
MSRRNLSIFLLLSVQLVLAGSLATQTVTTPVVITVTDPSGAGIAGAQVRVIPGPVPGTSNSVTDAKGQFSANLAPGGHALFVMASGFKSAAIHIDVKASKEVQTISTRLDLGATGSPVVVMPGPIEPSCWDTTLQVSAQPCEVPKLFASAYPYHEDTTLSLADLKSMPRITVTVHNPHSNADETYSGVRLADILAKLGAPLGDEFRGIAVSSYVEATGSDGYSAAFSLAEIDPNFHSGEIIVADTMNGKPLDAKSGPFKMVVTEDKRPARWVRNLTTIVLK